MLMVWLAHARALERWSGDLCTYSSLDRARVAVYALLLSLVGFAWDVRDTRGGGC